MTRFLPSLCQVGRAGPGRTRAPSARTEARDLAATAREHGRMSVLTGLFPVWPAIGDAIASPHRPGRRTSGRAPGPRLVINCARSGKDRAKEFVISFTSRPPTAKKRPVIRFVNTTGYPRRAYGVATGSCPERGGPSRACVVAVDIPGAK